MSITVMYPYDPNATRDECKIYGESHSLRTTDSTYRVIIPELAPFFEFELDVSFAANGVVVPLEEGRDYELGHKLLSAASIASKSLYGAIVITNMSLFGEFLITYRTVGGPFVGIRSEVLTFLANHLVDPVRTPFEKIIERPEYYTPHQHQQNWHDFLNKEGIEDAIDSLTADIEAAIEHADTDAVGYLNSRIDQLDAILEQFAQDDHIVDKNNPHDTTHSQADALAANASAVDTRNAYGWTVAELAEYINNRGITQDDIDRYLHKFGDQHLFDRLSIRNGQAYLRTQSGDTELNLNHGRLVQKSTGTSGLFSNHDFTNASEHVRFEVGGNVLEVQSSYNSYENGRLLYNGEEVVHMGNVRDKMANQGGAGVRIVSNDTESIEITGSSRPGSPVRAELNLETATLTRRGILMLSTSPTDTSTSKAASAKTMDTIRRAALSKALKTYSLNGHNFNSDFSLDKADINLGSVSNTNDLEKPVSTPQSLIIANYARNGHSHDTSGYEFPYSDDVTKGLARLSSGLADTDYFHAVATPAMGKAVAAQVSEIGNSTDSRIGNDVLPMTYWYPLGEITFTGWVVTIPADASLYMERVDYELADDATVPGATIDLRAKLESLQANTVVYFYISLENGVPAYSVSRTWLENTPTRLNVMTVKTNGTTIVDSTDPLHNRVEGNKIVAPSVTSMGMFRELEDHLSDKLAHIGSSELGNAASIGLDLIKNQVTLDDVSLFTHRQMEKWEPVNGTFTHSLLNVSSGAGISKNYAATIFVRRSRGASVRWVHDVEMHNANFYHDEDGKLTRENWWRFTPESSQPGATAIELVLGQDVTDSVSLVFGLNESSSNKLALWRNYGESNARKIWETTHVFENFVAINVFVGLKIVRLDGETKYEITFQRERFVNERKASEYKVAFTFRNGDFVIDLDAQAWINGTRTVRNTDMTVDYPDGKMVTLLNEGKVGFGLVTSGTTGGIKVSHFYSKEGTGEDQYLSAEALRYALGEDFNMACVAGKISDGAIIPFPLPCAHYEIHSAIASMGTSSSSISTDYLDAVDARPMKWLSGSVDGAGFVDYRELDRYRWLSAKYRNEADTNDGVLRKKGTSSYLVIVNTHV